MRPSLEITIPRSSWAADHPDFRILTIISQIPLSLPTLFFILELVSILSSSCRNISTLSSGLSNSGSNSSAQEESVGGWELVFAGLGVLLLRADKADLRVSLSYWISRLCLRISFCFSAKALSFSRILFSKFKFTKFRSSMCSRDSSCSRVFWSRALSNSSTFSYSNINSLLFLSLWFLAVKSDGQSLSFSFLVSLLREPMPFSGDISRVGALETGKLWRVYLGGASRGDLLSLNEDTSNDSWGSSGLGAVYDRSAP